MAQNPNSKSFTDAIAQDIFKSFIQHTRNKKYIYHLKIVISNALVVIHIMPIFAKHAVRQGS
jgi:hypothetical protein